MASPIPFPLSGKRIFVAGHRGTVGLALIRRLAQEECRIQTAGRNAVDLRDQGAVDRWFDEHRPEAVLLAAARVGGIHENDTHPGDFLYDNLTIATNVIAASRRVGVAKLLFLGSSCIYPRLAP
jgi:GDP-L-fucose synthase